MQQAYQYYARFQTARGSFTGLPPWARAIVSLFAIPGIVLLVLSFLGFLVSILALLLLTVPVYRLLSVVTGGRQVGQTQPPATQTPLDSMFEPGRRHVDVKIIESAD